MGSAPARERQPVACDLHVHTALSPCAEDDLSPPAIVERCVALGIRVVGITDHNSALNAEACVGAGREKGLLILPGMEVQTREDVHVLTFFDDPAMLDRWQGIVYSRLPALANREEFFGRQIVYDRLGNRVGVEERLLLTAADLSLEDVCSWAVGHGGLCVLSHVDRASYSVVSNLGFIPAGLPYDAAEVSARFGTDVELARREFGVPAGRGIVMSSDAHTLSDIGCGVTLLALAPPTWDEVAAAIRRGGIVGLRVR